MATTATATLATTLPEHLVQANPRLAEYSSMHMEQSGGGGVETIVATERGLNIRYVYVPQKHRTTSAHC